MGADAKREFGLEESSCANVMVSFGSASGVPPGTTLTIRWALPGQTKSNQDSKPISSQFE